MLHIKPNSAISQQFKQLLALMHQSCNTESRGCKGVGRDIEYLAWQVSTSVAFTGELSHNLKSP